MNRLVALVIAALMIAGCETEAGYRKTVEPFVGSPETKLLDAWGAPQGTYESGGTKYLTYKSTRQRTMPGTPPSYHTTIIGGTAYTTAVGGTSATTNTSYCTTTFRVRDEIVVGYSIKGRGCIAVGEGLGLGF